MIILTPQTVMALSDLEVGVGKAGRGKILDAKAQQRPTAIGLNPWKLARVTTEDAARAAARARAKSSILLPNRPGTELQAANFDTDSGLHSSSGSEIRLAGSRRSRRKRNLPSLPKDMWSKTKRDRISPLGEDSDAIPPNPDSSSEGLPPLRQEPPSPYRSNPNDSYSGDPRASFPPPRFPGQVRPEDSVVQVSVNSADVMRISANSDGYEASCGESGDDTSLSESWNQSSWKKLSLNPASSKAENVKPWVAAFPPSIFNPDSKGSPGGKSSADLFSDLRLRDSLLLMSSSRFLICVDVFAGRSVVSSGSRAEASILKANPELQSARMLQTSSPAVYEDSPVRESSDFLTDDATTSAAETPDTGRGTGTSTYFYSGPLSEPQGGSSRRLASNVVLGSRTRATDDP